MDLDWVNQLLQVAQKYQATINENNSSAVLHQDLQSSCNMFAATGRQLLKSLDLQAVNDFGFSKRYVRCLQIAEVVSSMKDLIDFSLEQKIGAIESLKSFPRQSVAEIQKQELEGGQLLSRSLSGDACSLDKDVKISPGSNSYINDNLVTSQVANSSHQSVHALNNYQNMLRHTVNMKQNVLHQEASSSLNKSQLQQEASSSLSKSKHALSLQFLESGLSGPSDASNNNLPSQHQHQFPLDGCLPLQSNSYSPRANQNMQQHVIQQMLQEMMNNSKETPQQSIVPVANANLAAGDVNGCDATSMPIRIDSGSFRNALDMQNQSTGLPKEGTGAFPSRNDSFKSAATASIPSISGNCVNSRTELLENLDFTEIDQIAQEFIDGGMFDGDSW
ncbi:putative transcriptional regulator SLK2 [Curcuma longa]|uniref:putative transcriptional regulator SLK2 n=1 Tax=Curcuma longa TaxID=136217 RepID=UPI003D9F6DEC